MSPPLEFEAQDVVFAVHEHTPDRTRWLVTEPGGLYGPEGDVPRSVNPCAFPGCDVWLSYPYLRPQLGAVKS